MPTAKNATTTTIPSRISSVPIELPLIHAKSAAGVMIDLQAQHTQGPSPMKDTHRWRNPRLALMAMLLPLAVASTAQNAADQAPAPRLAMVETAAPVAAPAAAATPGDTRAAAPGPPVPPGFDVARFEAMARAMVSNGRVAGRALGIVEDGRVLTARGY